jgi:hypothetical protein
MFIKFVSAVGRNQCDICGITSEELRLFTTPGAGADYGHFLISDLVTITAVRYSCRQQDCATANDANGDARYEAVFISSKASHLTVENRRAVPYCLLSHPIDQLPSGDAVGEACMIMGLRYQRSAAFPAINDQSIQVKTSEVYRSRKSGRPTSYLPPPRSMATVTSFRSWSVGCKERHSVGWQ